MQKWNQVDSKISGIPCITVAIDQKTLINCQYEENPYYREKNAASVPIKNHYKS